MLRRLRLFALLAIAALLTNSQCYALCLGSFSGFASEQRGDGCHNSSPSKKTDRNRPCDHRFSRITGVEPSTSISDLAIAGNASPFLFNSTIPAGLNRIDEHDFAVPEQGSPPGYGWSSSITVLRI
jgi:hypothetical protein